MSVVLKFGGTSVADADAIDRVATIVRRQLDSAGSSGAPPIVVVSALAKVTDALIDAARRAEEGDPEAAAARVDALIERHVAVATALTSGAARANLAAAIIDEFSAVAGLVRALAVLRDVSPRSLDAVVAAGELTSSRIVAAAFLERGIPAVWVDARQIVEESQRRGRANSQRYEGVLEVTAADGKVTRKSWQSSRLGAFGNSKLRMDGRLVHDLVLVDVKKPSESKSTWDLYKVVRKIPGEEAFRPISKECSLVN